MWFKICCQIRLCQSWPMHLHSSPPESSSYKTPSSIHSTLNRWSGQYCIVTVWNNSNQVWRWNVSKALNILWSNCTQSISLMTILSSSYPVWEFPLQLALMLQSWYPVGNSARHTVLLLGELTLIIWGLLKVWARMKLRNWFKNIARVSMGDWQKKLRLQFWSFTLYCQACCHILGL